MRVDVRVLLSPEVQSALSIDHLLGLTGEHGVLDLEDTDLDSDLRLMNECREPAMTTSMCIPAPVMPLP